LVTQRMNGELMKKYTVNALPVRTQEKKERKTRILTE